MRLEHAALPTFARHETFHPRYGWFRKAYEFASQDPSVFGRDAAPVIIGVGKNMVRAIRFWGLAAKVLVEVPHPDNPRAAEVVPTRLGHALFGKRGWDPFMEDPGTLWLLHWQLLAHPSSLPVWWVAYNEFQAVEFGERDLLKVVSGQVAALTEWPTPNPSSIKKDIGVLLRSYAPAERSRRSGFDELLDCPLRELGLITRSLADGSRYRFTLGVKPTLPPEIVTFAVLDFLSRVEVGGNTITTGRLAADSGSPGRVFKIGEPELAAAVEAADVAGVAVTSVSGVPQIAWSEDPAKLAGSALAKYYGKKSPLAGAVRCGGRSAMDPVSDQTLERLGLGRGASDSQAQVYWTSRFDGRSVA